MKQIIISLISFLIFTACQQQKKTDNTLIHKSDIQLKKLLNTDKIVEDYKSKPFELVEYFVDSTLIGKKGSNKIEAFLYKTPDSLYIDIKFYAKKQNNWNLKNSFQFEKDEMYSIDPDISDFNNDSFLDFNYRAIAAARGANNVRRLFIYDKSGDSLILIKNSLDYPNIIYNKKLNCIDSWMIHGCSSQAFLKIKKDSLIDFAWIHSGEEMLIYELDKDRNEKIITKTPNLDYGCYTRFESYRPLIPLKN